ncbi:ABC-type transport auxiliary lipoprotein family protein [Lysobacter fragariae]
MRTKGVAAVESTIAVGFSRIRRIAPLGAVLCLAMLGGCASLLGGGNDSPVTVYAPVARAPVASEWPTVRWQLALGRAQGARTVDSLRINVRPTPNELQVYKGAQWSKPPGEMLEDTLLRTLEDSGHITAVARQGSGIGSDYRLLMDVRRFESDYAGGAVPAATIEVSVKLLHVKSQQLAGSRTFLRTRGAASTAVPDVVEAFNLVLTDMTGDLAGWTLATGEQYEHARR